MNHHVIVLVLFVQFLASLPMPLELGMVELDYESEKFEVLDLKEMEEEA